MWMRILRFLLGCLLLPVCVAVTLSVVELVQAVPAGDGIFPEPLLYFLGGFALWHLIFLFLPRPMRAYVLAHELTHAFWGVLMGARVSKMRISRESGSVTLSKSNLVITLAPYFFPLYTFLVIVVFYLLGFFLAVEKYRLLWLLLVGLTWGFHVSFTISALMQRQSDIRTYGHLFSYALIYILNLVGLMLWLVMVASMTFQGMASQLWHDLVLVAQEVTRAALWLWGYVQ